jgi:hypothetical protein
MMETDDFTEDVITLFAFKNGVPRDEAASVLDLSNDWNKRDIEWYRAKGCDAAYVAGVMAEYVRALACKRDSVCFRRGYDRLKKARGLGWKEGSGVDPSTYDT